MWRAICCSLLLIVGTFSRSVKFVLGSTLDESLGYRIDSTTWDTVIVPEFATHTYRRIQDIGPRATQRHPLCPRTCKDISTPVQLRGCLRVRSFVVIVLWVAPVRSI
ncbi:hypothetical protein BS47DRAFT_263688 [Hydnum rufescens UP504]|uniref:Secreted protein n=1 Tax=Hydnum rufescens UP504 TaxID=1448309 RepID=A0A9P6B6Y5_9AGAM|nr:hypothetical protein BS47DRAFT_263688 [Hydnum rufescens UP504]